MFQGWNNTCVVVPVDWKGSKLKEPQVPPGRGFLFACPFAGCNRGANTQAEIQDHISRRHDIADPTKPKSVQTAQPKILRRRFPVPQGSVNEKQKLDPSFFQMYKPP